MPTWFWVLAEVLSFAAGIAVAGSWANTIRDDVRKPLEVWFRKLEANRSWAGAKEAYDIIRGFVEAMRATNMFPSDEIRKLEQRADGMLTCHRLMLDPRRWRQYTEIQKTPE